MTGFQHFQLKRHWSSLRHFYKATHCYFLFLPRVEGTIWHADPIKLNTYSNGARQFFLCAIFVLIFEAWKGCERIRPSHPWIICFPFLRRYIAAWGENPGSRIVGDGALKFDYFWWIMKWVDHARVVFLACCAVPSSFFNNIHSVIITWC